MPRCEEPRDLRYVGIEKTIWWFTGSAKSYLNSPPGVANHQEVYALIQKWNDPCWGGKAPGCSAEPIERVLSLTRYR